MPKRVNLSEAKIKKTLRDRGLKTVHTVETTKSANGKRFTFGTTTLVSDDPKTGGLIFELKVNGKLESKVLGIARLVSGKIDAPKVVEGTVIPLVHDSWTKTVTSRIKTPAETKAPDATYTAGFLGWAVSFSEKETKILIDTVKIGGDLIGVIGAFIEGAPFIAIFAIFVLLISLSTDLLTYLDDLGGDIGLYVAQVLLPFGIVGPTWILANPPPGPPSF